jgi:hypothetical protein
LWINGKGTATNVGNTPPPVTLTFEASIELFILSKDVDIARRALAAATGGDQVLWSRTVDLTIPGIQNFVPARDQGSVVLNADITEVMQNCDPRSHVLGIIGCLTPAFPVNRNHYGFWDLGPNNRIYTPLGYYTQAEVHLEFANLRFE